ncbi:LPS export ABC transporter periplasmic protein LptC [Thiomicrospira cyclica]|nr:LPS export ABC transporter periplasmic protein LptC [Thiomicrospira cyclica]
MTSQSKRLTRFFSSALMFLGLSALLLYIISSELPQHTTSQLSVSLPNQQEWRMQNSQTWTLDRTNPALSQQLISQLSYQIENTIYLQHPIFVRYSDQAHIAWADFGNLTNQQLVLVDEVNIISQHQDPTNNWTLLTDELHYDADNGIIQGPGQITFQRTTLQQTGRGYVYNLNLEHLTIKHEASTYYESTQTP